MTKDEIINKIQELANRLDDAETIGESLRLTGVIKQYEAMLDDLEEAESAK